MALRIEVYERDPARVKLEGRHTKFQADIIGPGFDHHGIASTAPEALINAAVHWLKHGKKDTTYDPR